MKNKTKKVFPIIPEQLEVKEYDKKQKISENMFNVPKWLEEKIKDVAEREGVDITNVSYKQDLFFDYEEMKWINTGRIIVEK